MTSRKRSGRASQEPRPRLTWASAAGTGARPTRLASRHGRAAAWGRRRWPDGGAEGRREGEHAGGWPRWRKEVLGQHRFQRQRGLTGVAWPRAKGFPLGGGLWGSRPRGLSTAPNHGGVGGRHQSEGVQYAPLGVAPCSDARPPADGWLGAPWSRWSGSSDAAANAGRRGPSGRPGGGWRCLVVEERTFRQDLRPPVWEHAFAQGATHRARQGMVSPCVGFCEPGKRTISA